MSFPDLAGVQIRCLAFAIGLLLVVPCADPLMAQSETPPESKTSPNSAVTENVDDTQIGRAHV